ncbi:E3 ubiquitin/ISG15 ligase TRIM25-like [Danio aesculapii]|uniref:E3 ubiquitin/ISG15 ligase TRIM25-like n=1 Tax=Danio aesculapii TaxID=1142201 RepID=UPI0024BFA4C3|nr:E3 ubiquitin/ISG15 ligase TRIM25-like [Danio aesculapii]
MAESSILVAEDQFICSVCLDLLKDPVTIPCGHSYCMNCISDYWNQDEQRRVYSCPQCRQTFTQRPALNKNVVFAEMVENLKIRKAQKTCALSYAGPGDVECDVCTGRKYKAVISCLVCLESYCQTHFERHEEFHSGRHKVTDATGQLKQMICSKHDKLLEIFCRTDQCCICYLCMMYEHRYHDTVAAVVERTEKQKGLEENRRKFHQSIKEKEKKFKELKEAVETHKSSAQTAVEDSERIFTELIQFMQRRRPEVSQMIRDREKTEVSRAEGLLKKLEQEIEDQKKRNTELEQLLHTDDHILFLQNFKLNSVSFGSTERVTISSLLCFDDIRKSVSQLREKLEDLCQEEKAKVSEKEKPYINFIPITESSNREEFLQYCSQFTLDSNTVNNRIQLYEGNRVAICGETVCSYPKHPDRFDCFYQVLCRESVCGRCYWEVEWSGEAAVGIAVSYKSIRRKGKINECLFGFNDQSWRLSCSNSWFAFRHNHKGVNLPVPLSSSRIGVYVDHRAGVLSFFSISDTMSLIHRVHTTFNQPLYPGFWVNPGSSVKLCQLTN